MEDGAQKFRHAYEDPFWRDVIKREADYLRRELASCKRTLDVGCAVGALERELAEFKVIGLDRDLAMLQEARKACSGVFILGDAQGLCFKDGAFDAIIFLTSLEFVHDYRLAIREAARVLAEGGRFVSMMLNPKSWHFQERLRHRGSYFNLVKAVDLAKVMNYSSNFFQVQAEYFLGVQEGRVFDCKDETLASLYIIKGRKLPAHVSPSPPL